MLIFLHIFPFEAKTFKGDYMIYKIRIKAREKQAECSAILFLSFFVLLITVLCLNLIPLVYNSFRAEIGEPLADVFISAVVLILSTLIYSALSMGADRFMLKRAENIVAGAGDIFYYFRPEKLISMCFFHICLGIRKSVILLFLSIPSAVSAVVFLVLSDRGFSAAVCGIFAAFTIVFIIVQLFTFRRISDTCFAARYMFIKGEYLNKRQLLAASQNSTVPHIKKLRQLRCSFSGWFLLCLLILPLPYVWSYYRQSKACLAAEILKSQSA